jgi:hypothetical protein
MFKAWATSAPDGQTLARAVEAHLNEYADEVVSVAYAVTDRHHILAVYRPLDAAPGLGEEAAVAVAEQIIEGG